MLHIQVNKHFLLLILFSINLLYIQNSQAQETENDTTLVSILKDGEINGHVRNYFMNTKNTNGKDYYTNAIGGLLSYESKAYKGFRIGVAGIFTYKAFSSDLNEPDNTTGMISKWEHELYDINQPDNYNDLDRLEELFLKYEWHHSYVSYGKIPIEHTPLLNKSDGRMKPFSFQGAWFHHKEKSFTYDVSWINKVSPRSTTEWFSFDEAIGLTSNGFQPDGKLADYRDQTPSKGIGMLHVKKQFKQFDLDFWNMYLDKFNNTSWIQLDYKLPNWSLGAIYSYQLPLAFQSQLAYQQRYVQPDEHGQVVSLKTVYTHHNSEFQVAFTKAFDTGRYLFPKELGRDQFYTSIPRSRLEGLGSADIVTFGYKQHLKHAYIEVNATSTFGIDSNVYRFNKYGIDNYNQVNTHLHYEFSNFMKGLQIDLLYVWKENKSVQDPLLVYQKSDYNQINLITNFNF